jgi:hypothetical protein
MPAKTEPAKPKGKAPEVLFSAPIVNGSVRVKRGDYSVYMEISKKPEGSDWINLRCSELDVKTIELAIPHFFAESAKPRPAVVST